MIPGLRQLLAGATSRWGGPGGCSWPQISEVGWGGAGWGGPRPRLTPQAPGLVLLWMEKLRQELVSAEPEPGACQEPPSPPSHRDSDSVPACKEGTSETRTPALRHPAWTACGLQAWIPGLTQKPARASGVCVRAPPTTPLASLASGSSTARPPSHLSGPSLGGAEQPGAPRAPPPAPRSPNPLMQTVGGPPLDTLKSHGG